MKRVVIAAGLVVIVMLGSSGTSFAQDDSATESREDDKNVNPLCCIVPALVVLAVAAIAGISNNSIKREGYAYAVPDQNDTGGGIGRHAQIMKIPDGKKEEHDNRKETGYW